MVLYFGPVANQNGLSSSGEGCPRCAGSVFHAEQMFSKGKTYHKVRLSHTTIFGIKLLKGKASEM